MPPVAGYDSAKSPPEFAIVYGTIPDTAARGTDQIRGYKTLCGVLWGTVLIAYQLDLGRFWSTMPKDAPQY